MNVSKDLYFRTLELAIEEPALVVNHGDQVPDLEVYRLSTLVGDGGRFRADRDRNDEQERFEVDSVSRMLEAANAVSIEGAAVCVTIENGRVWISPGHFYWED